MAAATASGGGRGGGMFAEAFASPAIFGLLYSFSNSVVVACIGCARAATSWRPAPTIMCCRGVVLPGSQT